VRHRELWKELEGLFSFLPKQQTFASQIRRRLSRMTQGTPDEQLFEIVLCFLRANNSQIDSETPEALNSTMTDRSLGLSSIMLLPT
jgi:hypothetical protein